MADLGMHVMNAPREFHRFIGAPPHRMFAAFDDPLGAMAALDELRSKMALFAEDDIWVLYGEEGVQRLDLTGMGHGMRGRTLRFFQQQLSGDVDYLRMLDKELRAGGVVLAVLVDGEDAEQVVELLRRHGGDMLARVAHWDYVPVPA